MFQFMRAADLAHVLGRQDLGDRLTDEQFIAVEIKRFRQSRRFRDMYNGERYYKGLHDVLHKKRTAIGDDGDLIEVDNLPNNRVVNNQYRKMVDQKVNYLLSQPFVLDSKNKAYADAVKPYLLNHNFRKLLKSVGKDVMNGGIGWIFPFYDEAGELSFRRFRPNEIIPLWQDAEHSRLEAAIRVYELLAYEGKNEKVVQKVEVFNPDGIHYFELRDGNLIPEAPFHEPYFVVTDHQGGSQAYNWERIPLVAFRRNEEEQPLICSCKSLQDGLNQIESMWQDQTEEDPRNTILVIVNYDGQRLGEFRRNLATYGAVKVRSDNGVQGDVKSLQIQVNAENYKAIIDVFKKAIIENCMGYDAKDDRLGSNANEMNLQSMYSDIEMDAKGMEAEFRSSLEELIWFVNCHLSNSGAGDFDGEDFHIVFNRDMMLNESKVIEDCRKSVGLISNRTIVANHPYVDDLDEELKQMQKEQQEQLNLYGDFGKEKP